MRRVASVAVCLLVSLAPTVPSRAQESGGIRKPSVVRARPAPPEMEALSFLVGTWHNTTEFLDAEGEVRAEFDALEVPGMEAGYSIEPALNGWILEGGLGGSAGRSWYRYEPLTGEYMLAAADFQGNFDVLAGGFEGDRLVLTQVEPKPLPSGGTFLFRWVFHDARVESYRIDQFMSRDEGESWVQVNRQLMRRMG